MGDLPREVIKALHRPNRTPIPGSKVEKEISGMLEERLRRSTRKLQLGVKIRLTLVSKGRSFF